VNDKQGEDMTYSVEKMGSLFLVHAFIQSWINP